MPVKTEQSHLEPPMGNGQAIARRGEELRKAGRYEDALGEFETALGLVPDHPWLVARRASVRMVLAAKAQRRATPNACDHRVLEARYGAVLSDLEQALLAAPGDTWTLCQRVEVLRCMKRHRECADACSKLLADNPRFAWAYQRRAWASRWLVEYDAALADIETALGLAPESRWCVGYRALLLGMMGRMGDAIADFDRVWKEDPTTTEWTLERGIVLLFADRPHDAVHWLVVGLPRDDGYVGYYYLAIAKALVAGPATVHREIFEARQAAERTLCTEARWLGEYMLAGLEALDGNRPGAIERLGRLLPGSDMLLEALVGDPVTRTLVTDPSLRPAIESWFSEKPQASKYLARGLFGTDRPSGASAIEPQ